MSKFPVAIIAALVAVATMYSPAAEAGLRIGFGFGGGLPFAHGGNGGYQQHHYRKRYVARRVKKEKVYVAKRQGIGAEGRQGREGCRAGGRRHGAGRRAGGDRR